MSSTVTARTMTSSEATLRAVMDAALDAIVGANSDGVITAWNAAATRTFGYVEAETVGRPLAMLMPDRFHSAHSAGLARFARTGAGRLLGRSVRLVGLRKDGSEFPMELSLGALQSDDGVQFTGVIRDLTVVERSEVAARTMAEALRAREAELRRSNEVLRAVLDGIPEAVFLKDPQSRVTMINRAGTALMGASSPADVIGKTPEQIFPPDAAAWARRDDAEVSARSATVRSELTSTFHGVDRTLATTKIPLHGDDGEFLGVIGITRDVTQERAAGAERAARLAAEEREAHFRTLAEAIPQIVWTADPDGDLDYYNQRWFDYTGMTLEETRGWGWEPVLHPQDLAACVQRWLAAVATGDPYEMEYRFKRASDGEYRWHLGRALPVRDADGKVVKWFGTCTDIHDQKLAVESLLQWEMIFEHIGWGVALIDADQTRIITANPAFERMHGFGRGKADGRALVDTYAASHKASLRVIAAQVAEHGHLVFDTVHARTDGSEFPVRISVVAVADADGTVTHRVAHYQDLTEQHTSEAARKVAEDSFQAVQDASPDAFMLWGVVLDDAGAAGDGVLEYFNDAATEMFGGGAGIVVGRRMHDLFPHLRGSGRFARYQNVFDTGVPAEFEFKHETLDRWLRLVVLRVGGRLGVIGTDVTASKEAEAVLRRSRDELESLVAERTAALHTSETLFRRAFEDSGMGIALVEPDGRIMKANRSLADFLGVQDEALVGRPGHGLTHPDDRGRDDAQFQALLRGEADSYQMEKRFVAANGTHRWGWVTVSMIRDQLDVPVYAVEQVTDIMARKEAEAALVAKAAELGRSNEELERFAYVASHDLQEPLRMVSSYTRLLEQRYGAQLDDEAKEYIGYAVDGADRMRQLIRDLLAYSRAGSRDLQLGVVDTQALVSTASADLRIAIDEASANITVDSLPPVFGDAGALGQLFQNLMANAVKFRGTDAPRIRIAASAEGDRWRFTVSDNGIGIAPEYHERIFNVFQRLHTREEYPGTGIGLSLCKRIVERHGGVMILESSLGNGSTFMFSLPGVPA
jgi:PAS domain S-box-containing protein